MILTTDNLADTIRSYLADLATMEVPEFPKEPIALFRMLKRRAVKGGRYPEASVFEVANRVMSDLVVLGAAERLLTKGIPGWNALRPAAVEVAFGVAAGWDLAGHVEDGRTFIGECFNVAPTFFADKKRRSVKGMMAEETAKHRILAFNADAREDSGEFERKSSAEWTYIVIHVDERLEGWRKL